ncbi:MAG: bifunctional DNA-formamidopyrimidine glycosylase/DNA-(apurinic or apyrimidinic site) lyase [Alphaproteobacteria bacterium]|nr:bifunctional DNA-formamidopyrimidine glycosylase/DNA-(apurinic or apyrimidinic site) lyase [Alphaproteobacteria bacterium]
MPELPEVETVCRGLRAKLVDKRIDRVKVRRPDLRIPFPNDFVPRLMGRNVRSIDRRAKYILMHLDDGSVLICHLGMSGRLLISEGPPDLGPHDHVLIGTDDGTHVVMHDVRRFGLMTLARETELDAHPLLAGLGLEPLSTSFDGAYLSRVLKGRRMPIKGALLDQSVMAGVGNIYACEALYHARISPRRLATSVSGRRAERLALAVKSVLEKAISAGGSSLRDYAQTSGELGYFQHHWAVYGREGEPCPNCDCESGIKRLVQSGRSTFYCPTRQR